MGRGSSRKAILASLGALTVGLTAAGCGATTRSNDPRPPLPVEVTVNVTASAVQAEPAAVGVKKAASANMTQNGVREPSADRKAPLVVNFTTSNTTATATKLEIHGPVAKRSGLIVADGNDAYKVALPNGHYTIAAANLPGAKPAPFYVGPARVSSQNDLLLP